MRLSSTRPVRVWRSIQGLWRYRCRRRDWRIVAGAPTSLKDAAAEYGEGAMSTVAKLLERKERLLAQLESGPGPNEREEIERQLAQIETALSLLEPGDAVGRVDE